MSYIRDIAELPVDNSIDYVRVIIYRKVISSVNVKRFA